MASKPKSSTKVTQKALPLQGSRPAKFTRLGSVSSAQLKLEDDIPVYVKITNTVDVQAKKKRGVVQTDPEDGNSPLTIDILKVVNLETGQVMQMVSGKALTQRLREYKGGNDAYVGLCFEITKKSKPKGSSQRWKDYEVFEIDGSEVGEGKV